MATLKIIPYAPKPPKGNIRKSISKSIVRQPSSLDKSFQIHSNGVPIEVPPALGGAAGGNDWCQKVVGDSETKVQDAQVSGDDLAGTRAASIAEKDGSDNNDTDDELPSLTRILSGKYKHISAEERPSMKDTAEMGNDQALGDNLFGSRGSRASGSYDEPIELCSDDKSKGDDSNFNAGHARRMVDSGQPGSGAIILEHPPMLSNRTASEHDNGDIGIDNTKSPRTAKRQRRCSSILPHTRTPPLPHNEDGKGSRENVDHSNLDESGDSDSDSWSKRRKVSAPPGGGTIPNRRHNRSQRSPSPVSEEEEDDDGTLSRSADSKLASTARTSPASESAPPTEPQLCPQVIAADQDWEVRQIIGKEDIDGVVHYLILLPEYSLGHAKEMVDKFEARLRAQPRVKNGRVDPYVERGEQAVVQADASGGPQQKRGRGRPRKQT